MNASVPVSAPADVMAYRIGNSTVGENIARAVADGRLIQHDDGTWELPAGAGGVSSWVYGPTPTPFPCGRLLVFLFNLAYGRAAVPVGCSNCYKVQVRPRTLRELHAVRRVAEKTTYSFKCGTTLGARHMSGPYAALFYADGLEQARAMFRDVRQAVDAEVQLGAAVPMAIKRGCSEYEMHCGPSDRFTFPPSLVEVEAQLSARLRPTSVRAARKPASALWVMSRWNHIAYQIGDETYRDFTGGRPLYPQAVTYDPEG